MNLSLVGMSGSGKSHWSAKLAGFGFRRYCCDDLISDKLGPELRRPDGTFLSLGEWMGFPFDPGYLDKEAKYLATEKEVVSEVLDLIEAPTGYGMSDAVVDTTGSVIYTGKELIERLRRLTTVVYFSSPPEAMEEMFRRYLEKPRPVLWHGRFGAVEGESAHKALGRGYRLLLESRELLYRELADVEVDYATRRSGGFGIPEFLSLVGAK